MCSGFVREERWSNAEGSCKGWGACWPRCSWTGLEARFSVRTSLSHARPARRGVRHGGTRGAPGQAAADQAFLSHAELRDAGFLLFFAGYCERHLFRAISSRRHPERIDLPSWRLRVAGDAAANPFELTVDDLQSGFEPEEITAVCQCSGNRRGLSDPQVPGVQCGLGAMGNAVWTGVRLKDLLTKAGLR